MINREGLIINMLYRQQYSIMYNSSLKIPQKFCQHIRNFRYKFFKYDSLTLSILTTCLQENETRTIKVFHFLTWPENSIPSNTKSIIEYIYHIQEDLPDPIEEDIPVETRQNLPVHSQENLTVSSQENLSVQTQESLSVRTKQNSPPKKPDPILVHCRLVYLNQINSIDSLCILYPYLRQY